MLRYFSVQDYMTYVVTALIIVSGINISSYSLISLLQLVNGFSFEESKNNNQFYEDASMYVYGVMLGLSMEVISISLFYLHGARLGNKVKSGVLGLLYKKVSSMIEKFQKYAKTTYKVWIAGKVMAYRTPLRFLRMWKF